MSDTARDAYVSTCICLQLHLVQCNITYVFKKYCTLCYFLINMLTQCFNPTAGEDG